jgi:hypothetical protein
MDRARAARAPAGKRAGRPVALTSRRATRSPARASTRYSVPGRRRPGHRLGPGHRLRPGPARASTQARPGPGIDSVSSWASRLSCWAGAGRPCPAAANRRPGPWPGPDHLGRPSPAGRGTSGTLRSGGHDSLPAACRPLCPGIDSVLDSAPGRRRPEASPSAAPSTLKADGDRNENKLLFNQNNYRRRPEASPSAAPSNVKASMRQAGPLGPRLRRALYVARQASMQCITNCKRFLSFSSSVSLEVHAAGGASRSEAARHRALLLLGPLGPRLRDITHSHGSMYAVRHRALLLARLYVRYVAHTGASRSEAARHRALLVASLHVAVRHKALLLARLYVRCATQSL